VDITYNTSDIVMHVGMTIFLIGLYFEIRSLNKVLGRQKHSREGRRIEKKIPTLVVKTVDEPDPTKHSGITLEKVKEDE